MSLEMWDQTLHRETNWNFKTHNKSNDWSLRMPCRIILESFFKEALITSLDVSLKTSYKNTNCQHKMGMLGNVHKIHKLEGFINLNR
jgi:hypothetical protein